MDHHHRRRSRRRSAVRAVALSLLPTALVGAASGAFAPPAFSVSPDVVISEVYGGGGNSGAPYRNDYIELYNRGPSAVSLSGWSTQYASASGTNYAVTALTGTMQPGARYLVQLGSGGSPGAVLPAPDATGSTNMSATSGKAALVTSTTALTCGGNCDAAPGVKDFLGYGSANDYETSPAPTLSNTTSATRTNPATDTDNNANDFAKVAPTPQNSQGGGGGDCSGYTTRIRDIQGSAHISPRNGQSVSGVRGVVTAVKSNGFWFQDPCPDSDVASSEGLFVFTSSAPSAGVGQEVTVGGSVTEFRSGGASTTNLTTTEITSPSVSVLGTKPVPAAGVIGAGGRVPPGTVIDNDAAGSVETSGTFDATTDGIDFYESLEGMRVQLNNPVAVDAGNSFNEIPVLADDGANAAVRTARGGILLRQTDANPERVHLDDAALAGSVPTGVNVGDHFSGPAVGVLDYSFGNFKLLLTGAINRVNSGLAPETAGGPGAGQISVATFNVENLDPSDPQTKFDGLAEQVVTNLSAPGILAVEEIQDNDGATNSSAVAADQTWNRLISAISAAGGPTYTYRQINPVDDQDGGEPGGNIRVGFLFRADIGLTFASGTPGGSTTAVSVSDSGNPADRVNLSHNPGRIHPANSAFNSSRKPLVGKFYFNSKPIFVIANHWNSKGGDDPLFGRYQPLTLSSEAQRNQQAAVVRSFVESVLAVDAQARVVVAGDLNDFPYSPPVQTLVGAGLTDLPVTLPEAERYTYVYEGNAQVLDHILLSSSLAGASHSYDIAHVNAEFAAQQSDHDPQVARITLP
ncbi:lamin tail domain-containing protein [Streptomyces maoxianensis]|uniref:Lamin tail domain-containing protein n=1 Tax=Streptomyces maoxianensis TaxID=1459942 RepID=A0ABV9G015_9ACTN